MSHTHQPRKLQTHYTLHHFHAPGVIYEIESGYIFFAVLLTGFVVAIVLNFVSDLLCGGCVMLEVKAIDVAVS